MKYCPKCGNKMDDDAQFCTKCGNKYTEHSSKKEKHNKSGVFDFWKKSDKSLRYIIVFLPIAVLGLIIYNSVCFHDWEEATCVKARTCSSCKKTEGQPLGHLWVEANCEAAKYCELCGKTEGKALTHNFVGTTCTEKGYCTICGKEGTLLGHEWIEATCTEHKKCSVCDAVDGEPIGHTWLDATCTEAKRCSVCDIVDGEPLEHRWMEATCTSPKVCSVCNEEDGEALGHSFEKWKVSKKATCGEDGVEESKCSVCSEKSERKIEKTGDHSYGDWKVRNEPKCTVNGARVKTCKVCKKQKVEGIPAAGHDFKESIIEEATYYECGTKGMECSKCGKDDGEVFTYYSFYKTKLSSIFADYRKNEIAADEKYDGMYIEFTATVRGVEASGALGTLFSDYGTIKFEINNGTWITDDVYCTIKNKEQLEDAKKLSVGTKATIKGKIDFASCNNSYIILYIDIIEIV